jgi:hypothetical protein
VKSFDEVRDMAATGELKLAIDDRPTRISVVLAWSARIALVAAFIFIGTSKFSDNPRSEWVRIFERIGWGQWFRYFTGAVQVTGAALMLVRPTLTAGAFLLACTMIGAMIVDLIVMRSPGYVLVPGALLGIVAATWLAGTYGTMARR